MNTKHTPGPWHVDMDPIDTATDIRAKYGWNGIDRIPNMMIAQVSGKRTDERDANARLIAAAPELLEALQEAANLLTIAYGYSPTGGEVWKLYPKVWNNARNAIAKATGEPQ